MAFGGEQGPRSGRGKSAPKQQMSYRPQAIPLQRKSAMKSFTRNFIIIALCLVAGSPVIADDARPNVLFIAVDDLNDWAGCLGGNPDAKTPNIDRLAARGMLFTNAQCPAPSCVPSRGALMTGVSPADSGLYCNRNGGFRRWSDLKGLETMTQYFSRHGYHTMGAGKILHNSNDIDYDERCPITYWRNPEPEGVDCTKQPRTKEEYLAWWKPVEVDVAEMTDWKTTQWTVAQLERKHEKPFFLACGIFRPHEPWNVPPKYYEKFPLENLTLPRIKKNDRDDLGPSMRQPNPVIAEIIEDETTWRKGIQAYLASINFADECVGILLDALDASPYKDNTIVILWSDHGWNLGEKLHWSKFVLWEESARCVLICDAPGVKPGSRCTQPVNLLDMYPTLLQMCDLPKKENLAGKSFVPQLKDPKLARDPSVTANEKGFSIRSERWRYIAYTDGTEELYDHDNDPMEWHNLAGKPEFARIQASMKQFVPINPTPPRIIQKRTK